MTEGAESQIPRPTVTNARAWLGLLLSMGLTLAVLYWIWLHHAFAWPSLRDHLFRLNFGMLLAIFAASAAFHVLVGAHKLHCALRFMHVPIRFGETLRVRLGAGPLRALLPLSSGELLQLLYFRSNQDVPLTYVSGIVAFDKATNFLGALSWFALGLSLAPWGKVTLAGIVESRWLGLLPVSALIAVILLALFFTPAHATIVRFCHVLHHRLGDAVASILAPFRELSPFRKLVLVLYGLLFQLRPIAVCFGLLHAFGLDPASIDALVAGAAAVLAGYLPGFVAGSGPREAILVEALRSSYAPTEAIFCAGVLMTLAVHIVPALLGVPWTWWLLQRLRKPPPRSGKP